MRKITFLSLIFVCLAAKNLYAGKITLAIKRLDVEGVKAFLAEKKAISKEHQNKLLKVARKNLNKTGKATFGISKSSQDIQKLVAGSIISFIGSCGIYFGTIALKNGLKERSKTNRDSELLPPITAKQKKTDATNLILRGYVVSFISSAIGGYGIKQIYKSINLYYAFANLQKADEIKKLIKNCKIKENINNN